MAHGRYRNRWRERKTGGKRALPHFVEELLGEQRRSDGSSNAMHAKTCPGSRDHRREETREIASDEDALAISDAALGHDLLEDSPIDRKELENVVGPRAFLYITELTNTWGDDHSGAYVIQVVNAYEELGLIKYADLVDNLFHLSYQAHVLGENWLKKFFIPIVEPMYRALEDTEFVKYPKTASVLRIATALARAHFDESLQALR